MYQLVYKLKGVKSELIEWAKKKDGILNPSRLCFKAKENMKCVQSKLVSDPLNPILQKEEKKAMTEYLEVAKNEEESIRLKSRVTWLKCADNNNKFFHTMQRVRTSSKSITALKDN